MKKIIGKLKKFFKGKSTEQKLLKAIENDEYEVLLKMLMREEEEE